MSKQDNGFESIFYNLPGLVFAKDLNLNYVGMNKNLLSLLNLNNDDLVIGNNDYHLQWQQYADIYQAEDKFIINKKKSYQFIEPLLLDDKKELISIVKKSLNYDENNNPIGVIGTIISLKAKTAVKSMCKLTQYDFANGFNKGRNSYIICDEIFSDLNLSKRESECLFYLIHGKTAKLIAKQLNISTRTVESYINNLKYKLNCETKNDIIDRSIELGIMHFIPSQYLLENVGQNYL